MCLQENCIIDRNNKKYERSNTVWIRCIFDTDPFSVLNITRF
jgi:hypothetical protein